MNTFTLDRIPNDLSAWDRMVSKAKAQRIADEEHEASMAQKVGWFASDLEKILADGNLRAPVFFAKRVNKVRAPSAQEVLWGAAECSHDLQSRLMTLLFFSSEGVDVMAYAKELRRELVLKAAELEAE